MNENVKLDIGCIYQGYCSDITRTFIFGDKQKQKIYDLVLKANMTAIKSIKVGQKFTNIDSIAREIITKGGYGKNFTHYIGHGVGIEIHEKATENLKNDCILKNNMVFTIEPGIYLQNKYGVRIEDTIAIKNNKVIVLTRKAKK